VSRDTVTGADPGDGGRREADRDHAHLLELVRTLSHLGFAFLMQPIGAGSPNCYSCRRGTWAPCPFPESGPPGGEDAALGPALLIFTGGLTEPPVLGPKDLLPLAPPSNRAAAPGDSAC